MLTVLVQFNRARNATLSVGAESLACVIITEVYVTNVDRKALL